MVVLRGCKYLGNVLCLKLGGGHIGVCYIFTTFLCLTYFIIFKSLVRLSLIIHSLFPIYAHI